MRSTRATSSRSRPRATLRRAPERDCRDSKGALLLAYVADGDFEPIASHGDHVWCPGESIIDRQSLPRASFVVQLKGDPAPRIGLAPSPRAAGTDIELSPADLDRIEWVKPIHWVEYTEAVELVFGARAARAGGGHG